ncbi:MAG: hypothetical protein SVR08_18630 [Spirochaetota bacterium]|nr:hypothetical protein [Spirochaetota bacterium]
MQRIGNIYDKVVSYENLYLSFYKALRGNGGKLSGQQFFFNLENELILLREELLEMSYEPSPFSYFKRYVPKERNIAVALFRDRVAHHAIRVGCKT